MSLANLPSELIYHTCVCLQRSSPPDIEALGRTCHRMRSIAAPLVLEHRELLRRYTRISLTLVEAAKLLCDITAKPWIVLYPRSLELVCNRTWRTLESAQNSKQARWIQEVALKRSTVDDADVQDLIQGCGLIPARQIERWVMEIGRGDEDYLFALMLACLPNLRRLMIHLDENKMEQTKEIIRAMKRESSRLKRHTQLKTVEVSERVASGPCDLEMFPLIAALPTVEKIHGCNLAGRFRDCYRGGWLSYPGASSSITHVSLETCGMTVEGLEVLMRSLERLQSFRYVAHRAGWGLHAIAELLKNAQQTLQVLDLSTGSGNARYIGPLRQFAALKHVTIDTDMLMRHGRMMRAVDILPASIETVTIGGNNMTKPNEDHFLADLYRPSFYFPHLKKIMAEDSWGRREIGKERLKYALVYFSILAIPLSNVEV